VVERELDVPWLHHLDPLVASGVAQLQMGSLERVDLAGPDIAGRWHVVEAKARTDYCPPGLIAKAKAQAARVLAINKLPPASKSGSVADLSRTPFHVMLHDPERNPEDRPYPVEFGIREPAFFEAYYQLPILLRNAGLEMESRREADVPLRVVSLPGT